MVDRSLLHILMIDDDEEDYFIVRQLLSQAQEGKFHLQWVSTFHLGLEALSDGCFDAVLVDYDLGSRNGVELIRKALEQGCPAPLLLLSGRGTYEVDVQAMEAGAADYLCKGEMTPAFLERAIRYAIERKYHEQILLENQIDLAHAQAIAHAGSWRLNVQQNKLFWSEETYRIFGISTETQLTYESVLDFVHPDDQTKVIDAWNAALKGAPYEIEHRILVGNTVKWVHERAVLEFDKKGALQSGFGIVQDISERKQAEYELRKALSHAAWLARFPDENPNPISRIASDGRLLYQNDAARQYPAWNCKIGEYVSEWFSPLIKKANEEGSVKQMQQWADRYFIINVVPFPDDGYIDLYGFDVTTLLTVENFLA